MGKRSHTRRRKEGVAVGVGGRWYRTWGQVGMAKGVRGGGGKVEQLTGGGSGGGLWRWRVDSTWRYVIEAKGRWRSRRWA